MASDILAIGMDHYFDQAPMLAYALKTGNSEMMSIFRQAQMLLYSNAALLLFALALSPPSTWVMVTIFFGPAFVWDFKLFVFGGGKPKEKKVQEKKVPEKNAFTIKRIPGMKAILIGVIRGYVCFHYAILYDSSLTKRTTGAGRSLSSTQYLRAPSPLPRRAPTSGTPPRSSYGLQSIALAMP